MTVYLVGAGPGDPGLLTLRGAELVSEADVIVFDRLVNAGVLALARPDATLIDAGKTRGTALLSQDEINALLVSEGRRVGVLVRLKGGDPYLFGRGSEEAAALGAAGIAYEVVPGVTALHAAPAAAGVPLTARGLASSVRVVTGHDPDGPGLSAATKSEGADETLVVAMGAATRAAVAERLLLAGRSPRTPVLVVESGTTPTQRSRRTTLDGLSNLSVESPATLVIGEVANLCLASYEDRPLHGWRVVVTRAIGRSDELSTRLSRAGAIVITFPTIEIREPADGGLALRAAAASLERYAWVVFTSANAVEAMFGVVRDARAFGRSLVAAIGPGTASALERHGVRPDLVPDDYVAEALLAAFPNPDGHSSRRVLLPRAEVARQVLPKGLAATGWEVDVVDAYRTVRPQATAAARASVVDADVVVFSSSSTVTGFLELLGAEAIPPVVCTIGPITSATARTAGLEVAVEASEHSVKGIVESLCAYCSGSAAQSAQRPGPTPRK